LKYNEYRQKTPYHKIWVTTQYGKLAWLFVSEKGKKETSMAIVIQPWSQEPAKAGTYLKIFLKEKKQELFDKHSKNWLSYRDTDLDGLDCYRYPIFARVFFEKVKNTCFRKRCQSHRAVLAANSGYTYPCVNEAILSSIVFKNCNDWQLYLHFTLLWDLREHRSVFFFCI